MKKTHNLAKNETKFGWWYYLWVGCNYMLSITFIGVFATTANINSKYSIGINSIWVMALAGIVVAICSHACFKMSNDRIEYNGGILIYVKNSLGNFWGLFVGFIQYIILPFLVTLQIMLIMKGTFSYSWVTHGNGGAAPWYVFNLGSFNDLWLDLISIGIYILVTLAVFGGIKLYKKLNNISAIVKFITVGVFIAAGIYLSIQNGHNNIPYWNKNSKLNFIGTLNTFNSCFFFFAGFEVVIRIKKNVCCTNTQLIKCSFYMVIINIIWHIIIGIIFFAAFSRFEINMNMGIWNAFSNKIIIFIGTILMLFYVASVKVNLVLQDSLYGSCSLQPLAEFGFFSPKIQEINKNGYALKATLVHTLFTLFIVFIWLIIPDLIKGGVLTHQYGFFCSMKQSLTYKDPFNWSSLTAASSTITTLIYIMALISFFKMVLLKQIKINLFQNIIFLLTLGLISIIFIFHYYFLISNIYSGSSINMASLIKFIVEFTFLFLSVTFYISWYFLYYKRKNKITVNSNENLNLLALKPCLVFNENS